MNVVSEDTMAVTVVSPDMPASLTFTPGNWDTPQQVTVRGEQDDDADDETVMLTLSGTAG